MPSARAAQICNSGFYCKKEDKKWIKSFLFLSLYLLGFPVLAENIVIAEMQREQWFAYNQQQKLDSNSILFSQAGEKKKTLTI